MVLNSHKKRTAKFAPPSPFQKRLSPAPANYKLLRGPCWWIKIVSNFSIKQLYVLYKPAASGRAQNKLVHICQKKSKNISFPRYSKFPFLYRDSRGARQGRNQGRVPVVPEPPLSRQGAPPLLFLIVILSEQECNGLSIPEILRFVLCLQ